MATPQLDLPKVDPKPLPGAGAGAGAAAPMKRSQWDSFESTYRPVFSKISSDAMSADSPGAIRSATGAAAADVNQAFDASAAGLKRQFGRYGISPGSGKYTGAMRDLALDRAGASAGAMTKAGRDVRQDAVKQRLGVAQIGTRLADIDARRAIASDELEARRLEGELQRAHQTAMQTAGFEHAASESELARLHDTARQTAQHQFQIGMQDSQHRFDAGQADLQRQAQQALQAAQHAHERGNLAEELAYREKAADLDRQHQANESAKDRDMQVWVTQHEGELRRWLLTNAQSFQGQENAKNRALQAWMTEKGLSAREKEALWEGAGTILGGLFDSIFG